jgi:ketosteroid isomerase-like protein
MPPDIASEIIALERAALDRSDNGDTSAMLDLCDADVVYFDPFIDAPILGVDALRAYYGQIDFPQASGEMVNSRVQVAGDVAVLTFNYISRMDQGRRINRWNTTEVYRRTGSGWRIIHTNWSLAKPKGDPDAGDGSNPQND